MAPYFCADRNMEKNGQGLRPLETCGLVVAGHDAAHLTRPLMRQAVPSADSNCGMACAPSAMLRKGMEAKPNPSPPPSRQYSLT
ncbi:MAG: hypothetical protein RSF82_07900, partial [Angelakisella sp.]